MVDSGLRSTNLTHASMTIISRCPVVKTSGNSMSSSSRTRDVHLSRLKKEKSSRSGSKLLREVNLNSTMLKLKVTQIELTSKTNQKTLRRSTVVMIATAHLRVQVCSLALYTFHYELDYLDFISQNFNQFNLEILRKVNAASVALATVNY